MEAQIFTPDSKRLVLHCSAHPHGSDALDPEHRYLLCDLDNDGELTPLTNELGVTAPSLSPDGRILYYFVDELQRHGCLTLKTLVLATGERNMIAVVDASSNPAPAAPFYPLSTISSDGRHIAIETALLKSDAADWPEQALWVFDTSTGDHSVPVRGFDFCNLHHQYCRDPLAPRTLMIQHNHGCRLRMDIDGKRAGLNHIAALDPESGYALRKMRSSDDPNARNTGYGLDLHIIEDDGTNWRTLPVGRDGCEFGQGHQSWRGKTQTAISSTLLFNTPHTATQHLVEMHSFAAEVHSHNRTAGGERNILSRGIEPPHFLHFATDANGDNIVSDYETDNGEWHLYTGALGDFGEAADLKKILNLGSRQVSPWHPHPFLSPDGHWCFFNSAASGTLQAYGVKL